MDRQTIDAIWNRAAFDDTGADTRAGDVALSSALTFHGMVMSGGFDHALDTLTNEQIDAAEAGYRWLGMDQLAELVRRGVAHAEDEDVRSELDRAYGDLVPADQTLVDRFEELLAARPEDFAPVG